MSSPIEDYAFCELQRLHCLLEGDGGGELERSGAGTGRAPADGRATEGAARGDRGSADTSRDSSL